MKLEKIVTLTQATPVRRLLFTAMERSLRAVGCELPVWVIPFDEGRFDLPPNCTWWEISEMSQWLRENRALPFLRKYQSLTTGNFQFADTDIIFLQDPAKALERHAHFVACCNHWRDYQHTCTAESEQWIKKKSTLWQRLAFNSGQYACEPALYTPQELMRRAEQPDLRFTCLSSGPDQAGINVLVWASGVQITHLTLPPHNQESSWVGDYGEDYAEHWRDEQKKPYLLHWAGMPMHKPRKIDELFYQFLSRKEAEEFRQSYQSEVVEKFHRRRWSAGGVYRRLMRSTKAFVKTWRQG